MKIGLVILHADPTRGGAERYTVDLAHALAKRGHVVSIVASTFPVMFSEVTSAHLVQRGWSRAAKYKNFLTDFDNHLHIAPYDVVHAMLPIRRCDVYHPHAGLAIEGLSGSRTRTGLPGLIASLVSHLNGRRRAMAAVEGKLLKRVRAPIVLCLSEYVKAAVRKYYPMDDANLATLFNAVDLKKFDPAARPDAGAQLRAKYNIPLDVPLAVMVAQDFARKGLGETLKAMGYRGDTLPPVAAERLKSVRLLVVGAGDMGPFRKVSAQLGVFERVTFIGQTDDVYAAYKAADFFVLPTHHDPCSLVVLESLAMGVPVITTKQNGAAEIMQDGVHGRVLETSKDIAALAAAMAELADPAVRDEMSPNCLALRDRLSFDRHVDELLAIYARSGRRWS